MARGIVGENAIRGAPVATMRIAETAEVHGPDPIDNSIRGVVGVASEDEIGTTALQEVTQIGVAEPGVAEVGAERRDGTRLVEKPHGRQRLGA